MRCESIRRELVGFHFGELEPSARTEVERHLMGCSACLGEFLSLKRDVEASASEEARPSLRVRSSLRAAVATELGLGPRPGWRWERPVAVAVAAVAVIVAMGWVQRVSTSTASEPIGLQRPAPSGE